MMKHQFSRKTTTALKTLPDGRIPETDEEAAECIRKYFFGKPNPTLYTQPHHQQTKPTKHYDTRSKLQLDPGPAQNTEINIQPVTLPELNALIEAMPDKSPGPDGFNSVIVKRTFKSVPRLILGIYNECLRHCLFPTIWKKARVVLIPKPNKELVTPAAFRPISLLPLFGKVLEKIALLRLQAYLGTPPHSTKMSEAQYGFTQQRSAEQACHKVVEAAERAMSNKKYLIAISLDVSGAFDNALWPDIISQLDKKKCPRYITNIIKSFLYNPICPRRP